MYVGRLPAAFTDYRILTQPSDPTLQTPGDLCRITYWKGQNGQLCRQERAWVTTDRGLASRPTPDHVAPMKRGTRSPK